MSDHDHAKCCRYLVCAHPTCCGYYGQAEPRPVEGYVACSFALGRGDYCKGDTRFPDTHATLCPQYVALRLPPGQP